HGDLRVREDGNERLCAVCAVKRAVLAAGALKSHLDRGDGHFPSTSSVAAAPFKKRLLDTGKATAELRGHLSALESLCLPAQVDERCLPGLADVGAKLPQDVRTDLLRYDGTLFYAETFTENQI